MMQPHLVIIGETGGILTKGRCSSCKDVLFTTGAIPGTAREHRSKLGKLFRDHFRNVHMRKDASQAAARIVKEGTEGGVGDLFDGE
jgi:hypothetical protein